MQTRGRRRTFQVVYEGRGGGRGFFIIFLFKSAATFDKQGTENTGLFRLQEFGGTRAWGRSGELITGPLGNGAVEI